MLEKIWVADDGSVSNDPQPSTGENDILCTAEAYILNALSGGDQNILEIYLKGLIDSDGNIHPNKDHSKFKSEGFSRDNAMAFASIREFFNIESVQCIDWKKYINPQMDFVYFLLLSDSTINRVFGYILSPLLMLASIVSCARNRKVRPAWYSKSRLFKCKGKLLEVNPEKTTYKYENITLRKCIRTDGKKLCLLRFIVLRSFWLARLTYRICTYFITEQFRGWHGVYLWYYGEPLHPICRASWILEYKGFFRRVW